MKKDDLSYEMDKDCGMDEILDESQNSYVALRRVRWSSGGDFKVDIRRYVMGSDGTETPMKGIGITDEGAHTLAWSLVSHGYGDQHAILRGLQSRGRDEFIRCVAAVTMDDDKFTEDYQKAKEFLASIPKVPDARFVLEEALGV